MGHLKWIVSSKLDLQILGLGYNQLAFNARKNLTCFRKWFHIFNLIAERDEEDTHKLEFGSLNAIGTMEELSAISEKSIISNSSTNEIALNNDLENLLEELESKVKEVSRNDNQNHLKTVEGSRVVG